MTHDEWVERALRARVEQGFPEGIEDDRVLDLVADAFARAAPDATPPPRPTREGDDRTLHTDADRRKKAKASAS